MDVAIVFYAEDLSKKVFDYRIDSQALPRHSVVVQVLDETGVVWSRLPHMTEVENAQLHELHNAILADFNQYNPLAPIPATGDGKQPPLYTDETRSLVETETILRNEIKSLILPNDYRVYFDEHTKYFILMRGSRFVGEYISLAGMLTNPHATDESIRKGAIVDR